MWATMDLSILRLCACCVSYLVARAASQQGENTRTTNAQSALSAARTKAFDDLDDVRVAGLVYQRGLASRI